MMEFPPRGSVGIVRKTSMPVERRPNFAEDLVRMLSCGDVGVRDQSIENLAELDRQDVVEALLGDYGLGSPDLIACTECAKTIGYLVQRILDAEWQRLIPRLVNLCSFERCVGACEQALVEIRGALGRDMFLMYLSCTVSRLRSNWRLWSVFEMDSDIFDKRALGALVNLGTHKNTRQSVVASMIDILRKSNDKEMRDAAVRVCTIHYNIDDCSDLIRNCDALRHLPVAPSQNTSTICDISPSFDEENKSDDGLKNLPASDSTPRSETSSKNLGTSRSCASTPASLNASESIVSTDRSRVMSAQLSTLKRNRSRHSLPRNAHSPSMDRPHTSLAQMERNHASISPSRFDRTRSSQSPGERFPSPLSRAMDRVSTPPMKPSRNERIPRGRSILRDDILEPMSHGDSIPRDRTPEMIPRGNSIPRDSTPEMIPRGNSIPRDSTPEMIPRGNSIPRDRTPEMIPRGNSIPRDSTPEMIPSGKSIPRDNTPDSMPRDHFRDTIPRGNSISRDQAKHTLPRGNAIPRDDIFQDQKSRTEMIPRHDSSLRSAMPPPVDLPRSVHAEMVTQIDRPRSSSENTLQFSGLSIMRNSSTANVRQLSSEPEAPPRRISAPMTMDAIINKLADDNDWAGQQETLDSIQEPKTELVMPILRLTSSLRSSLAKSSLCCVKRLLSIPHPVWKDLPANLVDGLVNALVKKSIDSSGFIAREAVFSLNAAVEVLQPQRMCNVLLTNCNSNPNANARAKAAECIVALVETYPPGTYDAERVKQCAVNKLMRDNSQTARTAAKKICAHLENPSSRPSKSAGTKGGPRKGISMSPTTSSLSRTAPASTSNHFSSPSPSIPVADDEIVAKLRHGDWQTRFQTLKSFESKLDPSLIKHVGLLVEDPNIKIRVLSMQILSDNSALYQRYLNSDDLALLLLPVANSIADRPCQAIATEVLQKFGKTIAVSMRRHMCSVNPKAASMVETILSKY